LQPLSSPPVGLLDEAPCQFQRCIFQFFSLKSSPFCPFLQHDRHTSRIIVQKPAVDKGLVQMVEVSPSRFITAADYLLGDMMPALTNTLADPFKAE